MDTVKHWFKLAPQKSMERNLLLWHYSRLTHRDKTLQADCLEDLEEITRSKLYNNDKYAERRTDPDDRERNFLESILL
jgi:hypothetical protein